MFFQTKKISYIVALSFLLTVNAQGESSSKLITEVISDEQFIEHHRCNKSFAYDVYIAGVHVGDFYRDVSWHHENNQLGAAVNASGNISILWLDSSYKQTSKMIWSSQKKHFITSTFNQKLTGIKAREMFATMSASGLTSSVNLDGEISQYESKASPLYDIDTLGAQIRVNLLKQQTHFTLYRQATDQVKKYIFEVVGIDKLPNTKWGEITAFKVKEVGEYSKMVLWFSPEVDYQMVQAQLDGFISPKLFLKKITHKCVD